MRVQWAKDFPQKKGEVYVRKLLIILAILLALSGCQSKQVRHLASDASLIKPGQTTRDEVKRYLGEPNGHRSISPGVEEYVYYEDLPGFMGHTPVISSWVDAAGYEMIIITLKDDLVTNCEFRTFSEADQEWVDDFTWEDVQ